MLHLQLGGPGQGSVPSCPATLKRIVGHLGMLTFCPLPTPLRYLARPGLDWGGGGGLPDPDGN